MPAIDRRLDTEALFAKPLCLVSTSTVFQNDVRHCAHVDLRERCQTSPLIVVNYKVGLHRDLRITHDSDCAGHNVELVERLVQAAQ